jgi:MFS family permease
MHGDDRSGINHPLAPRMAAIAFLGFNLAIGATYGTFSVLLTAMEARMGVSRELSSLGIPLMAIAIAVVAPVTGVLAGRISLRLLMILGTAALSAGFVVLAATHGLVSYLLAYALLIGPGVCIAGTVLPSTLVTRWFAHHRGRALGFVHMPIVVALMPLIANYVLGAYGVSAVYVVLAALVAAAILPMLLIVDRPPTAAVTADTPRAASAEALPIGAILRIPQFWSATVAFAALSGGAVLLAAHLVPIAGEWGFDPTRAATLLALMSFAGMAGTPAFGWLADKVGGRSAMAIAALDSVFLWLLLLVPHPSFALSAIVVGLLGFHGGAIVPCYGMTLSQRLGEASYSRAFGLGNMLILPVSMLIVPVAAGVVVRTGSYAGALTGQAAFAGIAALLVAFVGGRRARPA